MRYLKIALLFTILTLAMTPINAQLDLAAYPRGYLTTPLELQLVAARAALGDEPYESAVEDILDWADEEWDYDLDEIEDCPDADRPRWLDEEGGVPVIYAKALAYHLTGEDRYALEVLDIIAAITDQVRGFALDRPQCRLNLGWGIPEIIVSADLIAEHLARAECHGPLSWELDNTAFGRGNCRMLFQNWLAKFPYYLVSLDAEASQNNWGASATLTTAYIADYLWDRPEIRLAHRMPPELLSDELVYLTPAEAYERSNQLALDRMNGYRVDYRSRHSCDFLEGDVHLDDLPPVKSQITADGILPEESRRDQHCNITRYNDDYQNYPQLHLGSNIQQCELMLRRGDPACYDNITFEEVPDFTYTDGEGETRITHLHSGRGSIERAINAVIIDAGAEWRHDSALELALRYYRDNNRFGAMGYWYTELDQLNSCYQDVCFGTVTHGFAPDERPLPPPIVAAP